MNYQVTDSRNRKDTDLAPVLRNFLLSCRREPESVTLDKSGENLELGALNAGRETPIRIRQNRHLNNIIEQDHRAIKRRIRSIPGFKAFRCARILLGGVELMHMMRKRQMKSSGQISAQQLHSLDK
ncbi:hypothetical protein LMG29542_07746 [Paraburkholderia humisilvae]|uniref:DDE domain-containing protein n=1 Tax=Paraburkholderia humisilvae TaxID=627669 RepID=A0A6J5FA99_9BURK|nr:hypothetical protein LMG29542_07746 [Paraburkholderia humisilvae]